MLSRRPIVKMAYPPQIKKKFVSASSRRKSGAAGTPRTDQTTVSAPAAAPVPPQPPVLTQTRKGKRKGTNLSHRPRPNNELTAAEISLLLGICDPYILEIGANDGTDTVEFLRTFPSCRIRAYECDSRAISSWRKKLPSCDRAVLRETALGEQIGEFDFYPSGGRPPNQRNVSSWDKSGSLLKPDKHTRFDTWLKFGDPVKVPVTTLDIDLEGEEGIIDFVWMDVQGAEAMVLRGGPKTIQRVRWVYCEVSSRPNYRGQATLSELQALLPGFVLHSRHAENVLFRNTSERKS